MIFLLNPPNLSALTPPQSALHITVQAACSSATKKDLGHGQICRKLAKMLDVQQGFLQGLLQTFP